MPDNALRSPRTRSQHSGLFGIRDAEERVEDEIDFKMVTFTLGGKLYGLDIMMVKEIAKFDEFTFVPNTPPYVAGVYNLRGEIISVIDMRVLFRLPVAERAAGTPAEGLIVRLETGLIGVVVDRIDRVIGVSSHTIQPPHPIFADVNLSYISGVVEYDEQLYILLDVERILGVGPQSVAGAQITAPQKRVTSSPPVPVSVPTAVATGSVESPTVILDNLASTLNALTGFCVSPINQRWVEQRIESWSREHGGRVDVSTPDEAERFLAAFGSKDAERLWSAEYLDALRSMLPAPAGSIHAWNPGCGAGYETYSLTALLRSVYDEARLKVWAADNDLLKISTAPNLVFTGQEPPEFYKPYVVHASGGYAFESSIKDLILFEFSDVLHQSTIPPFSIVLLRDVLCYLREEQQLSIIETIRGGSARPCLVITGDHEDLLPLLTCKDVSHGPVRGYLLEGGGIDAS